MQPLELIDQVIGQTARAGQDRLIAQQVVQLDQSPERILAAPDVPAPAALPADQLFRVLRGGRADEIVVSVGAQVAIRLLKGEHGFGRLFQEGVQLMISGIAAHARGADDQLAPEFAAPVADDGLVVQLFAKGVLRLFEYAVIGFLGEYALLKEARAQKARVAAQARVLQKRRIDLVENSVRHGSVPPSQRQYVVEKSGPAPQRTQ